MLEKLTDAALEGAVGGVEFDKDFGGWSFVGINVINESNIERE